NITFQNNMANVNWPALTVAVTNAGGSNVAATNTLTQVFNGVGNTAQVINFAGSSNNVDFNLIFNGVSTNGVTTFRNDGTSTGINSIVLNGGLLGVGTDVLTTGGVSIWSTSDPQNANFDSQIFAEGAARTIKAVNFAELGSAGVNAGAANYRLGGRRELSDTFGLTISQTNLGLNAFPQSRPIRENYNGGAFPFPNNNFIIDDPATPVQFGGADTIETLIFPALPVGAFTISFNNGTINST